MSVIPPVTGPVSPSVGAAPPSGETADAAGANARSPERQIFDYAIELQQAALNDGGRLANPAALVSNVVDGLRGFFERARRASQFTKELEHKPHDHVLSMEAAATSEPTAMLHGGPAQQSLEPIGTDYDRPASSEIDDTGELADRLTDEMLNAAFVRVQATLIAAGTGHISGSVNTLLRGQ
jgi:hypothetical protein